jgi:hypothetical protein
MNNNLIKYIFFGNTETKTTIYNYTIDYSEEDELTKEALTIFEKMCNNFLKTTEVNKMPGQCGNFFFKTNEKIFYMICVSKNCSDAAAIKLLEELVLDKIGSKIKNRLEDLEKEECEHVVNQMKNIINKYESSSSENTDHMNTEERLKINPTNEKNFKNNQENFLVKREAKGIDVNMEVNLHTANNDKKLNEVTMSQNENIKKAMCSRNLKLGLVLGFLFVGIILAIVLPIVLSK